MPDWVLAWLENAASQIVSKQATRLRGSKLQEHKKAFVPLPIPPTASAPAVVTLAFCFPFFTQTQANVALFLTLFLSVLNSISHLLLFPDVSSHRVSVRKRLPCPFSQLRNIPPPDVPGLLTASCALTLGWLLLMSCLGQNTPTHPQ